MLNNKDLEKLVEKIESGKATLEDRKLITDFLDFNRVNSFRNFVMAMNFPIDWQWFHFFLMDKVDEMLLSAISRRVIVEMPPRHCKTLLLGHLLLIYTFGRYPDKVCVYATANEEKAEEEIGNIRGLLNSDEYQNIFPEAKVKSGMDNFQELDKRVRKSKKDTANVLSNINATRGKIIGVGRGSMLTGKPAHLSIADDLYKNQKEAESPVWRKTISEWFHSVFINRVDKISETSTVHMIIFFTRWHRDDLCGELMRKQVESEEFIQDWEIKNKQKWLRWELYSFQAIKTEKDYRLEESPIPGLVECSQADPREIGEPLWRKYNAEYAQIRLQSPVIFEAQYQQNPPSDVGILFTKDQFHFYNEVPKNINRVIVCIDASFKNTLLSDHVGLVVLGMIGNTDVYLLNFMKVKANYVQLKRIANQYIMSYSHYYAIVIEEAANGVALICELRQSFPRIVAFNPHTGSKREKAQLALPTFAAGNFHVPAPVLCPNILDYIHQFTGFTGEPGNEDDLVDATVIGVLFYNSMRFSVGADAIRRCPNEQMARLKISQPAYRKKPLSQSKLLHF